MTQRNLRQQPRICYYEPEEPDLDQYVFCEKCGDYVYEYCSIHGPLLVIPDDKVPAKPNVPSFVPRAALTIPHVFLHITYSIIPGAGLGVFSSLTLPSGVRFGPYRGQRTDVVDSTYCWQIYDKNRKPLHCVDAADANKSNWMRYVNCARHWREQNLVAFQYQGELYYRTIKIIPRFTELMVFYGSEFACELDVDLGKYNSPAGYAQKFGAPSKKRKPNDDKTKAQKEEIQTKSANTATNNVSTTNQGGNIKDITKETQRGQVILTALCPEPVEAKETQRGQVILTALCPEPVEATDSQTKTTTKSTSIQVKKTETTNNDATIINAAKSKTVRKNHKAGAKNNKESKRAQTKKNKTSIANNKPNSKNIKIYENVQVKQNKRSLDKPNTITESQESRHNATNNLKRTERSNVTFEVINKNILDFYIYCNDCNKRFILKQDLQKHLRFHDLNRAYACDVCKLRYLTMGDLTIHINDVHTKHRTYVCNVCDTRFTQSGSLKTHMRRHTGDKPYACNVCDTRFTQSSNLKTHMRRHTGEKPYACNVCDTRFSQSSYLKTHMRCHTGDKPYACNVCDTRFTQSSNLKTHMRRHTGEKPYACNVCDTRFSQSSYLKTHMRCHTGDKPYACNVCDMRFIQSSDLKTHMRRHTGDKPYACNVCDTRFTQSSNLKTHMRRHTGEKPYACNVCDTRFSQSGYLKTHMRCHTGDKPYACNVCDMRFIQSSDLKTHMRRHTGEKPYACEICDTRFSRSSNLKNLLMKIHLK